METSTETTKITTKEEEEKQRIMQRNAKQLRHEKNNYQEQNLLKT
jgi:hypothetical protein